MDLAKMTDKELAASIMHAKNAVGDHMLKANQCVNGTNYRNESDGKPEYLKAQQHILLAIGHLEALDAECCRRWAEQANGRT